MLAELIVSLKWDQLLATIFSLLYLYLEVKEKKLLWIVGIVSSALYAWVCLKAHLYADFGLNIYYALISVYGWINWSRGGQGEKKELPIIRIDFITAFGVTAATVAVYVVLVLALSYIPDYFDLASSSLPYLDALIFAASITGTWMLSKKIIEQWYVWILVNSLGIVLFAVKGIYIFSALNVVYTVGSVIGLLEWRKHMADQTRQV